MPHVLLTNDDGVTAEGLIALRGQLLELGLQVSVVAPDGNRSGMARAISFDRPVGVVAAGGSERDPVFACTGSPVDCVRVGALSGLVPPVDLVVSGINHGLNVGDDVTYSGTVAAAMEGLLLGLPAIAVSQQSEKREMDFRLGEEFVFDAAARFTARVVAELEQVPLPPSTLLNVNVPAGEPHGVEVARLGKRIYRDRLSPQGDGRYFIYGADPGYEDEPGTDLVAVAAGRIAVTPVHLDLTYHDGIGPLSLADLERMLAPAAHEVE
jgi:5'-nucleotidase